MSYRSSHNPTLNRNPNLLMSPIIRIRLDQPNQHRNDSLQAFLPGHDFGNIALAFCDQNIQGCGALQSRASGNIKKAATIRSCEFPITFCEIERNRSARAVELVANGQRFRELDQKPLEPRDKNQRLLMDFQLFVVEHACHGEIRIRSMIRIRGAGVQYK